MKLLNKIKYRLKKEVFLPTHLSVVFNPLYIIRRGLFKTILGHAHKIEGCVLDFGCGSKPYESLFTQATQYIGVDLSDTGHDHRHSKIDAYYDGMNLPFPDNYFDAVVSFEVMEHVFNAQDILMEIRRVLKPGGRLLLSVPFAWEEHEQPYDFARYTSYGIIHLLQGSGFKILKLDKTTSYVLSIFQMFIAYLVQHVLPKNVLFRRVLLVILIPLINLSALLIDRILPKNFNYFSNIVVLVERCE